MPTTYRPRAAPCSRCHDVVLIAEATSKPLFGLPWGRRVDAVPAVTLEHADPGPDGKVFDGVDGACRRRPVR